MLLLMMMMMTTWTSFLGYTVEGRYRFPVTWITLRLLLPRPLRQNLLIRLHEVDSTVPLSSDVAPAGYPNKNNNKASFCRLALRKHVSTQKVAESTKFLRRLPEENFL